MSEELTLTVRTKDESLELALLKEPPVRTEFGSNIRIRSDAAAEFVLNGLTTPFLTVRLMIDGVGEISTWPVRDGRNMVLTISGDRGPFESVLGFARLSVHISRPFDDDEILYAEPIEVLLPPGRAADNLKAMLHRVERCTGALFRAEEVLGKARRNVLYERLKLLADIEAAYEKHYPYFRENARYTLKGKPEPIVIEKVRTFASGAAEWVANRPHELERVQAGKGFRAYGRSWLPKHAPGIAKVRELDIPENRAVAGFAVTVVRETAALADALALPEGTPAAGAQSLAEIAESLLAGDIGELRSFVKAFGRLGRLYRAALTVEGTPLRRLPPASAHFFETAPYRIIYKLMQRWFSQEPVDAVAVKRRLAALTGPRLFEYYALLRILDGLAELGYELESSSCRDYSDADRRYDEKAGAAVLNTFVFRKDDVELTVFYQPVVSGRKSAAPGAFGLYRATSLAFKPLPGEAADTLRSGSIDFYTPDYVMAMRRNGRTAWAILDAKYSTLRKVKTAGTASLSFKYLTSIRPVDPDDAVVGLWLLCGYSLPEGEDEKEGSVFDIADELGRRPIPDLSLVRINAMEAADRNPAKEVTEAMEAWLQHEEARSA